MKIVENLDGMAVRLSEFNGNHDSKGKFAAGHGAASGVNGFGPEWRNGLSSDEHAAFDSWITTDGNDMAAYLRHGATRGSVVDPLNDTVHSSPSAAELREQARLMDGALARAAVPRDGTVWRGLEDGGRLRQGAVIHDKSFVSTSLSYEQAHTFTNYAERGTVAKVVLRKGQHAAYISPLASKPANSRQYDYSREQEVLLPRNSTFKVTGKDADGSWVMELQQ